MGLAAEGARMSSRGFYRFLMIGGLANLLLFGAECAIEGGSATFGAVRDGHYFLYHRLLYHGNQFTEVSADVFRFNQIHSYTIRVTTPLLVLGLALRRLTQEYPMP